MPETRFGEMAGTGIIKAGTTFSINPIQKLRIVTITDRISVPSTDLQDDSAASVGYVKNLFSEASGGILIGNGLTIKNGVVSLTSTQELDMITLSSDPERPKDVVTVDYVSKALSDMASRSYVATALESVKDTFVDKKGLDITLTGVASQTSVDLALSAAETRLRTAIHKTEVALRNEQNTLADELAVLASQEYVDEKADLMVAKTDLNKILIDKASVPFVESTLAHYVAKKTLDQMLREVATVSYVADSIRELISRREADSLVADLASRDYVDNSVAGLATIEYVDRVTSALPNAQSGGVQYVKPDDEHTIVCEGPPFLVLDPTSSLQHLTIVFPGNANDGQQLTITTSWDIEKVSFSGLQVTGEMTVPAKVTLTAGAALRFVYAIKADAWFVI